MDPVVRRAALIATGVTLPLVVVVALALGSLTGDSDPDPEPSQNAAAALSFAAPPRADVDAASCAKVLAQLPVDLGKLPPRVVRTKPDTPFVVAWGSPPVVLRCGVDRPEELAPGSGEQAFNAGDLKGPYYFTSRGDDGNVYTVVDRAAYVSITIPGAYQAPEYLIPLVTAIGKGLPTAVCSTDPATADLTKLCTRRK